MSIDKLSNLLIYFCLATNNVDNFYKGSVAREFFNLKVVDQTDSINVF